MQFLKGKRTPLVMMVVLVLTMIYATACENTSTGAELESEAGKLRTSNQLSAQAQHPIPQFENYPVRKALVEFAVRLDDPSKIWYTYILSDNGSMVGYYASSTRPQNSCNFLSSNTKVVKQEVEGTNTRTYFTHVVQSPSLDGVYYGASQCDAWFFFDAATDAMIEIRDVKFFTTDQPLLVDVEEFKVKVAAPVAAAE